MRACEGWNEEEGDIETIWVCVCDMEDREKKIDKT
jgi:hypothetical protein